MATTMKIEHLNYCRQIALLAKSKALVPSITDAQRREALHVIDVCLASQKFLLPFNGKILDDDQFRALDDSMPLRLPHPFIALEFIGSLEDDEGIKKQAKRVVFCTEDADDIFIWPFAWLQENGTWANKPTLRLPKVNYLDRSNPKDVYFFAAAFGKDLSAEDAQIHDVKVMLGFCNALACSNVYIERSQAKKADKKIKAALPFDCYHILTIDTEKTGKSTGFINGGGSHRSPREHLRRGHIVRPGEGRKPFWRNATVVCAGRGFNKVEKDYRIKNSSHTGTP